MTSTIESLAGSLGTSSSTAETQKSESLEELSSDDFMELMLAQIQNQDPTQPLDSNEMMSQMASFSTSAGVSELNDTANGLMSSLQSSQALQVASLVGQSVLVPGENAHLAEGGQVEGQVDLPASANGLRVGIYDDAGQKVDEIDLGAQAAGVVRFSWNGTTAEGDDLPAGHYTLDATATIDGEQQSVGISSYALVESVSLGSGGSSPTLNLADNRSIDFSQVREVR